MKKRLLILMLAAMLTPEAGRAQGCTICTNTAAQLDDKSAKGMNGGILYLAFLPLTILGTVGYFWWRQTRGE